MTQKQESLLSAYAGIMLQIKELEAARDAMKDDILKVVEKSEDGKIVTELGAFTKTSVSSWEYSDATCDLEDKLKIKKLREREKGIAKETVKYTVRFNPKSVFSNEG